MLFRDLGASFRFLRSERRRSPLEGGTSACADSIGGGTHDPTAVFRAAEEGVPQAISAPGGARVAIPVYGERGVSHVAAWSL